MKKYILILFLLEISPLALASNNASDIICNSVYYFDVDHLNKGQLDYNVTDLNFLFNEVNTRLINSNLNKSTPEIVNNYVLSYSSLCNSSSPLPLYQQISSTNVYPDKEKSCDLAFNSTIIAGGLQYTLPITPLYFNTQNCQNINFLKAFFNLEKDASNYSITGVRLWFPIFLSFVALLAMFLKINLSINKELRKYGK